MPAAKGTVKMDYAAIRQLLAVRGFSKQRLSQMMGQSVVWYGQCERRDSLFEEQRVEQMALILNCSRDAIVAKEEPKPVAEPVADIEELSDVEKVIYELRDMLKDIRQELTAQKTMLEYLYNKQKEVKAVPEEPEEPKAEEPKSDLEKCCKVIDDMLQARPAVLFDEYIQACRASGVTDTAIAKAAVAKRGHASKLRGFGGNKKYWIGRKAYMENF